MNEFSDIKPIKAFLLRHGHTQEEIDRLDREGIIKLYEKDTRTDTINFLNYMNEDEFIVTSTLDEADIGELKLKVCENAKLRALAMRREKQVRLSI